MKILRQQIFSLINYFVITGQTFPDGPNGKSLLDSAKEISSEATEQWESVGNHGTMVEHAADQLDLQKQAVVTLKNSINSTALRDNQVNMKLLNLQDGSRQCKSTLSKIM